MRAMTEVTYQFLPLPAGVGSGGLSGLKVSVAPISSLVQAARVGRLPQIEIAKKAGNDYVDKRGNGGERYRRRGGDATKDFRTPTEWPLCDDSSGPSLISTQGHGVQIAEVTDKENIMKQLFTNLMQDESGQDLIEYALVAALVGLGAVAAMKTLASNVGNSFNTIGTTLNTTI